MADRPSKGVRERSEVPPEKCRGGAFFLRFFRGQSPEREHLPRRHPEPYAGNEFLLLPRFRGKFPGNLQTCRIHSGDTGKETGRQKGPGMRLSSRLFLGLTSLRRRAPNLLSR